MGKKKLVIVVIILLAAGALGAAVYRNLNKEGKPAADVSVRKIPVSVEEVQKGDMVRTVPLGGLLQPAEEVYLAGRNPAAKVVSIPVKVGDRVEAGTPLIFFDSRDFDIQYNQALTDYERNKQLFEAGALSKYQFEQIQNALDNLRLQKEYLILTSPVKGMVSSVTAVEGQLAGAGPLASVVDISKLKLEVLVGENFVNKLEAGGVMEVSIPSVAAEAFQGVIASIAPNIDPMSKTYPVTLEIDNPEGIVKGGMYAEVKLVTDKKESVIVIPQFAILDQEQKKIVFVVENGTAVRREVKIGLTLGNLAEVTEGLIEGEMLVVEGQYGLKDGSSVAPLLKGGQQ